MQQKFTRRAGSVVISLVTLLAPFALHAQYSSYSSSPTPAPAPSTASTSASSVATSTETISLGALPGTPVEQCQSMQTQMQAHSDFSAASTWKRIPVRSGKFSIEMPHADGWKFDGQPILPYTLYDFAGSITLNNQSAPKVQGIHFGRYTLENVCTPDVDVSEISIAAMQREYAVTWTKQQTWKQIAAANVLADPSFTPQRITVGGYQALVERSKIGSCVTDALVVQALSKTFTISSPCRQIRLEHLRIAASLRAIK